MAQTLVRSTLNRRLNSSLLLPKRLLSSTSMPSLTQLPSPPSLLLRRRPFLPLSHAVHSFKSGNPSLFTSIRCRVNRASDPYSPLDSGPKFRPPRNEMATHFPGCDYEHWLIIMDQPGGIGATKQQMIDCYVQTLARILGSEEEAKKKIYNVSCKNYFGFGCEIDEETADKLEGQAGVLFVLPDSYVDPQNKNYGGVPFVNGELVERSYDRPSYYDRTRYVLRRDELYSV